MLYRGVQDRAVHCPQFVSLWQLSLWQNLFRQTLLIAEVQEGTLEKVSLYPKDNKTLALKPPRFLLSSATPTFSGWAGTPDLQRSYYATQLAYAHWWLFPQLNIAATTTEAAVVSS